MKKLLLSTLIVAGAALGAQAQTTVQITSAGDSTWGALCPTPVLVDFFVNGNLTGYDPAVDSADIYVNFGDGNDTLVRQAIWPNGPNQVAWGYVQHLYTSGGTYSTKYIITMPDGNADTMTVISDLVIGDTCGTIDGKAYIDNNSNCAYDGGDDPLTYAPIWLVNNATGTVLQWAYTDSNGDYWFNAPTAVTYDIVLSSYITSGYTATCPSTAMYTTTAPSSNLDFAVECMAGFDLAVNGYGAGFVPGQTTGFVNIYGSNLRCQPTSGQLKIVSSDPLLSYSYSWYNAPDAMNGDTLIWNFSNINQQNVWWWWGQTVENAHFYVDTTAQIGDTVCFELIICPSAGDADVGNNTMNICVPIVASYDPNNKVVSPIGQGAQGNITANQKMTYTVNFQNTGTAPAMNIFVLDTVDTSVLELNSMYVISTSHQLTGTKILNGNVVKFNFDGINLPDSNSNEPASHGWITFVIDQKPNLAQSTQIQNQAGIYFDWNPVVETNWTLNTIDSNAVQVNVRSTELGAQLARVFPNPASTQLYISLPEATDAEYMLFDMSGKLQQSQLFSSNLQTINVNDLENGVYILIINSNGKMQHEKIVITR